MESNIVYIVNIIRLSVWQMTNLCLHPPTLFPHLWSSLLHVCLNSVSFYLLSLLLSAILSEKPSRVMLFWVFDHWVVFQHVDYKASHLPSGCCRKGATLICLLWCWWLKAFADLERVCFSACLCECVCVWSVCVCPSRHIKKGSVTVLCCDYL